MSFYKQFARAGRVCLLGGVEQATWHRRLLPRRCTNHGLVRDVLVLHYSRLEYALSVKRTFIQIIADRNNLSVYSLPHPFLLPFNY